MGGGGGEGGRERGGVASESVEWSGEGGERAERAYWGGGARAAERERGGAAHLALRHDPRKTSKA